MRYGDGDDVVKGEGGHLQPIRSSLVHGTVLDGSAFDPDRAVDAII